MNWDALGAIGEIVGAGAVVLSLVYLSVQIRTQNKETRLIAMHEIATEFRTTVGVFQNTAISDIFIRANEDYNQLTDSEAVSLISAIYPILRVWEEAYIQFSLGRLDGRLWEAINSQFASYMSYPALNKIWMLRKQHFDQEFQQFVANLEQIEIHLR
jgi:hypothetical protein